jgi:hypothetical protein
MSSRRKVDAVSISEGGEAQRKVSLLSVLPIGISAIALILSLTSLYVTESRAREKERRDHRAELRQLVQRLLALPKENAEALKNLTEDAYGASTAQGAIQIENSILSLQASELAEELDDQGLVDPAEHLAIAGALGQGNHSERAIWHAERGLSEARNFTEKSVALQVAGKIYFKMGDVVEGRNCFNQLAEELLAASSANPASSATILCMHYASWAHEEVARSNCQEAHTRLQLAEKHARGMISSSISDLAFERLLVARQEVAQCQG